METDLSKMKQNIDSTYPPKPPEPVVDHRNNTVDSTPKAGAPKPPEPVVDRRDNTVDSTTKKGALASVGQVLSIHTLATWEEHMEASKTNPKLIVINFTAKWCKPCQMMKPIISEFASSFYKHVEFVQIDIDELAGVAEDFKVQIMPTFLLMKKGKVLDQVKGAKKNELANKIEYYRKLHLT